MNHTTISAKSTWTRPAISKAAFWDVDYEHLDRKESAAFIIPRVFERWLRDEQLELIRFYGKKQIKSIVTQQAYFSKTTFGFLCGYFNLQMSDFTCYMKKQQWHPELWPY